MLFTEVLELLFWSQKVLMFLAPTWRRNRKSLEFSGSKRGLPNLTSHINTAVAGPSSVILCLSLTAIVEHNVHQRLQTLFFR
jgi:hypothetical protein